MPPARKKPAATRKPATAKRPTAAKKPPAKKPAAKRKSAAKTTAPAVSVTDAVKKDLAVLAERDPELANGAIAATALALARTLDDRDAAATSQATCARALTEIMEKLRAMAPAEQKDGVDDLKARRAARRAAGGAAT